MKARSTTAALSAAALLAGCTFAQRALVLGPVGPSVAQSQNIDSKGTLVVYSALDVHEPDMSGFGDVQRHSDYKLFTEDGKLLQFVHNHPHHLDEEPAPVRLPAGRYRVVADSNGYGVVTVLVVIEASQTTTVHLEGGGSWPNEAAFTKANSVRLPDGQVVGYRAAEERIP